MILILNFESDKFLQKRKADGSFSPVISSAFKKRILTFRDGHNCNEDVSGETLLMPCPRWSGYQQLRLRIRVHQPISRLDDDPERFANGPRVQR
jgi:hypothetical protein